MTIYQAESTDPSFPTFRSLSEHKTREHLAEYLEVIAENLDPGFQDRRFYWKDPLTESEHLHEKIKRISVGPCDTVTALGHTYQILSPTDPESPDELKRLVLAEYMNYPIEDITKIRALHSVYSCDDRQWMIHAAPGSSAHRGPHENGDAWFSFYDHLMYQIT